MHGGSSPETEEETALPVGLYALDGWWGGPVVGSLDDLCIITLRIILVFFKG